MTVGSTSATGVGIRAWYTGATDVGADWLSDDSDAGTYARNSVPDPLKEYMTQQVRTSAIPPTTNIPDSMAPNLLRKSILRNALRVIPSALTCIAIVY
ncbi:MAG: hypothetical protein IJE66_07145 [Akkermansia sp.]|nr:hypothetical protein [Akkermansia sp.]